MIRPVPLAIILLTTAGVAQAETAPAAYGNNDSTAENVGVLGGMTAGALAGGPPGLIVGAAIGALLGDGWNARRQVADLQFDLYESRLRLAMLQEETERLQANLAAGTAGNGGGARVIPARVEMPAGPICCDNTVVSLYFRSGASAIEEHELEVLNSLANLSRRLPDPVIEITGYADRNGDAVANLQLSRRRSESVQRYLHDLGLGNTRITTVAYGESRPLQATQDLEADFFDRRVIVRLRDGSQLMLTRHSEEE